MATWKIVKFLGRKFYSIPPLHFQSFFAGNQASDNSHVLIPWSEPDDGKEFPSAAKLEQHGPYFKSGISEYEVFETKPTSARFSAIDMFSFSETEFYFECARVLSAHGWLAQGGTISSDLLRKVVSLRNGEDLIATAKDDYGDNWESYIYELAAANLSEPLSRLWYAGNLMSLYFAHPDADMTFGYLWCEYRMKMRHEVSVLKREEIAERSRENGEKGGLAMAARKRRRYDVLNGLASIKFPELGPFPPDRNLIRCAQALASEYDKRQAEPLFKEGGSGLSRDWFEKWLEAFRCEAAKSQQ